MARSSLAGAPLAPPCEQTPQRTSQTLLSQQGTPINTTSARTTQQATPSLPTQRPVHVSGQQAGSSSTTPVLTPFLPHLVWNACTQGQLPTLKSLLEGVCLLCFKHVAMWSKCTHKYSRSTAKGPSAPGLPATNKRRHTTDYRSTQWI